MTDKPNWKLHRLLDFVRVPSPFVGTELQGEPGAFSWVRTIFIRRLTGSRTDATRGG